MPDEWDDQDPQGYLKYLGPGVGRLRVWLVERGVAGEKLLLEELVPPGTGLVWEIARNRRRPMRARFWIQDVNEENEGQRLVLDRTLLPGQSIRHAETTVGEDGEVFAPS